MEIELCRQRRTTFSIDIHTLYEKTINEKTMKSNKTNHLTYYSTL